jgi:hypothetical protein
LLKVKVCPMQLTSLREDHYRITGASGNDLLPGLARSVRFSVLRTNVGSRTAAALPSRWGIHGTDCASTLDFRWYLETATCRVLRSDIVARITQPELLEYAQARASAAKAQAVRGGVHHETLK